MKIKIRQVLFIIALLSISISSCKKETEEIIVPGNTAPPDNTISNVVIENYINKVYISVLGRKSSETEFNEALAILNKNSISVANRNEFLDIVLNKSEYGRRTYDIAKADLLNNLDSTDLYDEINLFTYLLTDSNYVSAWPQLTFEKTRLETLANTVTDFNSGQIDIIGLHKRCVDNYFYDQINMGSENFVVSMFQHFLNRYPTDSELADGVKMVDGQYSFLFLTEGQTKDDFISIFFNSDNYYEGQVFDLYLRYLFRKPTSDEMAAFSVAYKNSKNYKELQKSILALDEYVGL